MNFSLPRVALRWRLWLAVLGVLGIGLTVTAIATIALAREARLQDAARFDRLVRDTKQLIETRAERYEAGLLALREFFDVRDVVTPAEWNLQMDRFAPTINFPGLVEVGCGIYLGNAEWRLEPPEWIMSRDPGRKPSSSGEEPRRNWLPIIHSFHAPGRPPIPYGTELYPDDWKEDVPQRAIKSDSPNLSRKKRLPRGGGQPESSGFTMYLPLYAGIQELAKHWAAGPPQEHNFKVAVRESMFRGLIFASFSADELFDSVFGKEPKAVEFELFAWKEPKREHWLNDRSGVMRFGDPSHRPYKSRVDGMRWYGEAWSIYFYTTPVFIAQSLRYRPWLAAGFGVPVSLLLAGITLAQARGRAKAEHLSESLRQSEARLQIALKERERMSRDLHDGTIQSLYAIGLGLGQLRRSLGNALEKERLEANLVELDHVVSELRGYLVVLDPGVSPAQSAAAALSELVERLRQTAATELHFTADPGVGDGWPPAAVLDVLLAAREGVSNALRHGHATVVELSLQRASGGEVLFAITDNGKGFEPSAARPSEGHGLANLERRARAWHGWLCIESRPGGPTRLTLTLFPFGGQLLSTLPPNGHDPKREFEPGHARTNDEPKANS